MQRDKIMNNKDWNAVFGQQECVGKYQILRSLNLPNYSKIISFLLKWYLGLYAHTIYIGRISLIKNKILIFVINSKINSV